jgi:hypothetical protein
MTIFSALGVLLAVVAIRHHRAAQGTVQDSAAAAAAHLHTLPTSASISASSVPGERRPHESGEGR